MIGLLSVEPVDKTMVRYSYTGKMDYLIKKMRNENIAYSKAIFVNLTNHSIKFIGNDSHITIPMSGIVLRCKDEINHLSYTGGIRLNSRVLTLTDKLPDKIDGVWYITSFKTALAANRNDFITPSPIRKNSKIIGCKEFFRIKKG